jgi:alpha-L-fucosidase
MTTNDCWGYVRGDHNWRSPHHLVQNLVDCSASGGNFLLNIGPQADGSVPEECVGVLRRVGRWLRENGASIYDTERCLFLHGDICAFTRRANTLYVHVYYWPGEEVTIGGVTTRVRSAKLLATSKNVAFVQHGRQLILSGLPQSAPDDLITVIAVECESEPVQHALSSIVDET